MGVDVETVLDWPCDKFESALAYMTRRANEEKAAQEKARRDARSHRGR